jgi:hypothetical protein
LSELLYAALEIRFALERMTRRELAFSEMASKRMRKEYSPSKHVANLQRLDPDAAFPHDVFIVLKATGERFRVAEYRPLDKQRVSELNGRLGDLLHPKEGLLLGIPTDPWYSDTKRFLTEAVDYLSAACRDNAPFFAHQGIDQYEMVRSDT